MRNASRQERVYTHSFTEASIWILLHLQHLKKFYSVDLRVWIFICVSRSLLINQGRLSQSKKCCKKPILALNNVQLSNIKTMCFRAHWQWFMKNWSKLSLYCSLRKWWSVVHFRERTFKRCTWAHVYVMIYVQTITCSRATRARIRTCIHAQQWFACALRKTKWFGASALCVAT